MSANKSFQCSCIPDRLQATGRLHSTDYHFVVYFGSQQVVKLSDVFPYGTGFVLVFEYMLSDLSEVLRNSTKPLTEVRTLCELNELEPDYICKSC